MVQCDMEKDEMQYNQDVMQVDFQYSEYKNNLLHRDQDEIVRMEGDQMDEG